MSAGLHGGYDHNDCQVVFSHRSSMKKMQNINRISTYVTTYNFPAEAIAENDGRCTRQTRSKSHSHGASCQGESETVTASDDSYSLKRKSIIANAENDRHTFMNVLQNFCWDSLTSTEKKKLQRRLKVELGKLQALYHRLEVRESQLRGVSQSTVSERSQSYAHAVEGAMIKEEQEKHLLLQPEFPSSRSKMPASMKSNSKLNIASKHCLDCKLNSGEQKRQKLEVANSKKLSEIMRQCNSILRKLMLHKFGWVFNTPVDVVKLGLHDYFKIIKKPMDLGTISSKLEKSVYASPLEFAEDVRLTFSNAMIYNPEGDNVHTMAASLKRIFEERWKQLDEKIRDIHLCKEFDQNLKFSRRKNQLPRVNGNSVSLLNSHSVTAQKDSKGALCGKSLKQSVVKDIHESRPPMTFAQKCQLSRSLKHLPFKKLDAIVEMIKQKNPNLAQTEDEIEVDFEDLDTDTLWEIHDILMNYCKDSNNGKKKLPNGFEFGSQIDDCKGARVTNVNAIKDVGSTNCVPSMIDNGDEEPLKYNKSMSSRVDSRCSSAGSDSVIEGSVGITYSAETSKVSPEKEPTGSDAIGYNTADCAYEINVRKRSMFGIEVASGKETAIEAISQQGGENIVSESQLSPEKFLRAALLKNRFADIILKAQEKTSPLNKGDRLDPEKLRKEREDLERRQREGKARLQAEARAAELLRKKAEAEAAAEARRKREAERKAARLALQKMGKTVEIDENVEILKDLAMFQAAPGHLPSSGDESSPAYSPDDVPAFTLQGRNPLEQLGLYMKDDEDDEEERETLPPCRQRCSTGGPLGEDGEIEG